MLQALTRLCHLHEPVQEDERTILTHALAERRFALHRTYEQFNTTSDPDLIDAALFEIKAHQAHYAYLLRQIKQLDEAHSMEVLKAE